MSTKKFEIRSALREHLLELSDLPNINWENQVFTPGDDPYIRETLLPADETLTANNERTGIGIWQLDLFVPMGYSISEAESLADKIKQHFRPAQVISNVILERSFVGQGNQNDNWYFIPISIDYRAHSQNLEPA